MTKRKAEHDSSVKKFLKKSESPVQFSLLGKRKLFFLTQSDRDKISDACSANLHSPKRLKICEGTLASSFADWQRQYISRLKLYLENGTVFLEDTMAESFIHAQVKFVLREDVMTKVRGRGISVTKLGGVGLTVRDYNDDRTKRLPDVVFCFDNAKRCSLVLEISHSESMRHVQEKSRLYMTSKSNMVQTVVCFHVQYLRRSGNGRSDTIAVNEPPQVREIKVFIKQRVPRTEEIREGHPTAHRGEWGWKTIYPIVQRGANKPVHFKREDLRLEGDPNETIFVWNLAEIGKMIAEAASSGAEKDGRASTDSEVSCRFTKEATLPPKRISMPNPDRSHSMMTRTVAAAAKSGVVSQSLDPL